MKKTDKIYVAGHGGLAGSAIVRRLRSGEYANVVTRTRAELDLTDQAAVQRFFAAGRPDHVFLAAAKVGGILAHTAYPAQFLFENLSIASNVIRAAWQTGTKKLLFVASSCAYPKFAPQPMREEYLLTGALEPINEAFAVAKLAGIKMCAAYNRQHRTDFMVAMSANLYGPGSSYDLANCHVLPALIRKAHEAKEAGTSELLVWGSGRPRREFLYSDDFADACVLLMEQCNAAQIGECINVGTGRDQSIRELAETVAQVVKFPGKLVFDPSKPDGAPRKVLDVSRLASLGWWPRTPFVQGVELAYSDFKARYADAPS